MDELLARPGIRAKDFAFLYEVDGKVPVLDIECCVVLQVPIQAISLLDKDRAAGRMLPQIPEHLVESGPAALAGRFDIDEFLRDDEALLHSVFSQEAQLCFNTVALLPLF